MNIDTGEVKKWADLTEEEKASGKWKELKGLVGVKFRPPMSKSDIKREEYMRRVAEKRKAELAEMEQEK